MEPDSHSAPASRSLPALHTALQSPGAHSAHLLTMTRPLQWSSVTALLSFHSKNAPLFPRPPSLWALPRWKLESEAAHRTWGVCRCSCASCLRTRTHRCSLEPFRGRETARPPEPQSPPAREMHAHPAPMLSLAGVCPGAGDVRRLALAMGPGSAPGAGRSSVNTHSLGLLGGFSPAEGSDHICLAGHREDSIR